MEIEVELFISLPFFLFSGFFPFFPFFFLCPETGGGGALVKLSLFLSYVVIFSFFSFSAIGFPSLRIVFLTLRCRSM